MMFPRLTLIPKTCLLRVIDNDTGVEVPQLFHKVIPHHYKPNKVTNLIHRQSTNVLFVCVYVQRIV